MLSVFLVILGLVLINIKTSLAFDQNYPVSPEMAMSYAFKNSNLVYLTLSPNGLGGYILAPIYSKLLEVNTNNGKIITAISQPFHAYSFFQSQNRLIYVTETNINILNLKNKKTVFSYNLPSEITNGGQITVIKISNDAKKALFIAAYGPDQEHSVYYSLDLKTKKLTKIKTVNGIIFKF